MCGREIVAYYKASPWIVTGVVGSLFWICFWCADKASPLRSTRNMTQEDALILADLRAKIGDLSEELARKSHGR